MHRIARTVATAVLAVLLLAAPALAQGTFTTAGIDAMFNTGLTATVSSQATTIRLYTAQPTTATSNEISESWYGRQTTTWTTADAASSGYRRLANAADVVFGTIGSTANTQTPSHVGLTRGTALLWYAGITFTGIGANRIVQISDGNLRIEIELVGAAVN